MASFQYSMSGPPGAHQVHEQQDGPINLDPPGDVLLHIVSAHYGTHLQHDVTQQARNWVQSRGGGRRLTSSVGMYEIFGDPQPGHVKKGRIVYYVSPSGAVAAPLPAYPGAPQSVAQPIVAQPVFTVGVELVHQQQDGPINLDPPGDLALNIISAHYGDRYQFDVTQQARNWVASRGGGRRLTSSVGMYEIFGDPQPGVLKHGRIVYTAIMAVGGAPAYGAPAYPTPAPAYGAPAYPTPAPAPVPAYGGGQPQYGAHQHHEQDEGMINIDPPGEIEMGIVSAHYGDHHQFDVTQQARNWVASRGNNRRLTASNTNEVFGDVQPGVHKRVRIIWCTVVPSYGAAPAPVYAAPAPVYVAPVQPAPVYVAPVAPVASFGGSGVQQTLEQGEGPIFIDPPGGADLYIISAHYGDRHQYDVTQQARNWVQSRGGGKVLNAQSCNEVFGDPEPGVPKRVRIIYSSGGGSAYGGSGAFVGGYSVPAVPVYAAPVQRQPTYGQHQTYNHGEGQLYIDPPGGADLHIVSAHYGDHHQFDVTQQARNWVATRGGGKALNAHSPNEVFGDPQPGVHKHVRIVWCTINYY